MTLFGIFVPDTPDMHREALQALAQGFGRRSLAYRVYSLEEGYRECDVVVTFGVAKLRTQRGRAVASLLEHHASHRSDCSPSIGTHLVIERGFLRREVYYMLGWDGLNGRANYFNSASSGDRWRKLKMPVSPWRDSGNHIVLCGQIPWDASVQSVDHVKWCRQTAYRLAELTDRPIHFRPHPLQPEAVDMSDCPVIRSRNVTLAEDLLDAWAVVTFSSNAGVEATLAGVPTFVADPGAMGYPLLNHDITHIESPAMPPREQWFRDLAYTQWTLAEIASGAAIAHLWCKRQGLLQRWIGVVDRLRRRTGTNKPLDAWQEYEQSNAARETLAKKAS